MTHDPLMMTGEAALGRGAWDAGITLAAGYPGSPATHVLSTLLQLAQDQPATCHVEWSVNERVALDIALGVSLTGHRSLVVTKSVGFNTIIDELHLVNLTGVHGGLVIVLGDDPLALGSQNNQDTRLLARAVELPLFEPRDPADGYTAIRRAYDLSEQLELPVVVRITRDFSAMQSAIAPEGRQSIERSTYPKESRHWLSSPPEVERLHRAQHGKLHTASVVFNTWPENRMQGTGSQGIVVAGQCAVKLEELSPQYCDLSRFRTLALATTWPLPEDLLAEFCENLSRVLVIEEGEAFVESHLRELAQRRGWPVQILGRLTGTMPDPISISAASLYTGISRYEPAALVHTVGPEETDPPLRLSEYDFEAECPFSTVFNIFRECVAAAPGGDPWVIGEPGCNVRLNLPPFELFDYRVAMGSASGVATGAARGDAERRTVAVIGDSAFIHSGLSSLVNAVIQGGEVFVLIMDNQVLGVTGCQPGPTAGRDVTGKPIPAVDLEALCKACGVSQVERMHTLDESRLRAMFTEGLAARDLRVLILEYPCDRCYDAMNKQEPPADG